MGLSTPEQGEAGSAPRGLQTRLAVLIFTDIVGSTDLKNKLGMAGYSQVLARHNELFEVALTDFTGAKIIKHTGDGYFATFPTASEAVKFALAFQSRMSAESWQPSPLRTRVGIHAGEVQIVEMAGRHDVVGLSADIAARLMSLAVGGQVLLTRGAFDDARQFVREGQQQSGAHLKWMAHGPYLFKGSEDPMEVFEVGLAGISPLARPADSEKAKRVARHEEEGTLGWRPALGQEIPGKSGWLLDRKLGEGGFGEVWLGLQPKFNDRRVFKFCFDAKRVRSLKREYALFRLMRETLGERKDIAKLYDIKLDEPPYYLESEYTDGGNLVEWAGRQSGIGALPLGQRLEIVARICEATSAAHR